MTSASWSMGSTSTRPPGRGSRVAAEIQKAGLAALQDVARLTNPVVVGHSNLRLRPEWLGIWVLHGGLADQVGQKINDIGFYQ